MRVEGITHTGNKRKHNEDRYLIHNHEDIKFFIVADGMGGYNSGEVASAIAVDCVSRALRDKLSKSDSLEEIEKQLVAAVTEANKAIYFKANDNPEYAGMGTTFLVSIISGNDVIIGNIGDSRAYLQTKDTFKQVTVDDSYVNELIKLGKLTKEEARNSNLSKYVTKSLGNSIKTNLSLYRVKLSKNDTLLLCSDGLTSMISDDKINEIITENDIHAAIDLLLKAALDAGGLDNISIILIKY